MRRFRTKSLGWLVALLAIMLLVACTQEAAPPAPATPATSEESEEPTAAPEAEEEAEEPAQEEPTAAPEAAEEEAAAPQAEGTFTYWGGLIFSDTANQMLVDRVEQWGAERGVDVEVVMINQNETVQRVSAAIEAGNMPDAFDVGRDLMLLLSQNGQIEPVDELFDQIGEAHGGWIASAADANDPADFGGNRYGIPFGTSGNLLFRRADVLEPAGFTDPPQTWEEVGEMSRAAQNPPEHYGMGFALSNVGDGNLTTTMLQSWGGRIADDSGTTCTIDSPETRAFLEWITQAYADGLFPPGATTWDGAGDNTAYQSGNALFIANPGSVYLYMRDNDPDLAEGSKYSALPAGPEMRLAPQNPNFRVISADSPNKELAEDLLAYLADDEFMQEYFFNAIYGPVLQSQVEFPIFQESPVHQGLLDLAVNGTLPGYPDVNNAAFAEYQTNFLTPKMVQRIVVDNVSIDEAIAETQAACQAIYDKYPAEGAATEAEGEEEAAEEAPAAEAEAGEEMSVEEAVAAFDGTFTYWGGLIFSDTANQMLVDRVEQWGTERGVDVETVMINQNETVQRVSAAIEAGNMPDALDVGRDLMLLLSQNEQLVPVDELFDQIGEAHGGWIPSAADANDPADFGGNRYGIPFGTSGNLLFRRADVLEPAGFTDPPQTWEEVGEMARAAQNPPEHYGMGFALSNVGDGNLTTTMLQSWGGRIADDSGTTCTIDSPETRAFLEWITQAYADGLFPPGATTWDGAGDNTAYQSGNALFIANPGSVYLYMRDNDPDLAEGSKYSALPAGPEMRLAPQGPNFRVIPSTTKSEVLAKDLLAYLADDEFMQEYFFNAIYGPVLQSQVDFPIFQESPVHQGLLDLAVNGTLPGYPDVNNAAFAEYQTNFLTPKMVQRIVVDNASIDEAIAETQAACQAIYDKY